MPAAIAPPLAMPSGRGRLPADDASSDLCDAGRLDNSAAVPTGDLRVLADSEIEIVYPRGRRDPHDDWNYFMERYRLTEGRVAERWQFLEPAELSTAQDGAA